MGFWGQTWPKEKSLIKDQIWSHFGGENSGEEEEEGKEEKKKKKEEEEAQFKVWIFGFLYGTMTISMDTCFGL